MQIVDARNPLLFRCEDLEAYVKEVDENKINLILINKSDLLTLKQRLEWCRYFEKINCKVVFWSAFYASEANAAASKLSVIEEQNNISKKREINNNQAAESVIEEEDDGDEGDDGVRNKFQSDENSTEEEAESDDYEDEETDDVEGDVMKKEDENTVKDVSSLKIDENLNVESPSKDVDPDEEKCKIITREELIVLFKTIHTNLVKIKPGSTTIGMVG